MATTIAEQLQVRIAGQASKRGLIPRTPAGERLLADAATWLAAEYPDEVRRVRHRALEDGTAELALALHPAAPDLILRASDSGQITAEAETTYGIIGIKVWIYKGEVREHDPTAHARRATAGGEGGGGRRPQAAAS